MIKNTERQQRVAYTVQRALEEILRFKMIDPSLKFVTITRVKVSSDLSYATAFVLSLNQEAPIQVLLKTLKRAASRLRYALAHAVKLRVVPELRFVHDASFEEGKRLNNLIEQIPV